MQFVDQVCFLTLCTFWLMIHLWLGYNLWRRAQPPPRMILIVMGGPASGKRTQARRLADRYGLPLIYGGELIREEARAERRNRELQENSMSSSSIKRASYRRFKSLGKRSKSNPSSSGLEPITELGPIKTTSNTHVEEIGSVDKSVTTFNITAGVSDTSTGATLDDTSPISPDSSNLISPKNTDARFQKGSVQSFTASHGPASKALATGDPAPNDLIFRLFKAALSRKKCPQGFVVSGYPLSEEQHRQLDLILSREAITACVVLKIDEETALERAQGRLVHMPSGRRYHTKYAPPVIEGKDNETGEELTSVDDSKALKKKLQQFKDVTLPVLKRFPRDKVVEIESNVSPSALTTNILIELDAMLVKDI